MILQAPAIVRNQSRPVLAACAAVPALFLAWFLFGSVFHKQETGALHLLIPATSSNTDLCKLLLSGSILHYPVAALINWGAPEAENAYVQHLAKVVTILDYLHKLEDTQIATQDDLILILDGYDIWLQLRPEVLLKRYYKVIEATDARSVELYGQPARHTILFGPDKICWPVDFSRPACWAVPHLPLDDGAWGPPFAAGDHKDEHNMPRWLNSGTILGPLGDMRDMFQATLDLITNNHTTDSDQFYFANIWGDQEFARLSQDPVRLDAQKKTVDKMERWEKWYGPPARANADIKEGQRTEYYVTLDYLSELFQTAAFYKQFLTWMRPDHSWLPGSPYPGAARYRFDLPRDIQDSPTPYEDLERDEESRVKNSGLIARGWRNLELCINTVTKQVPVSLHFTGEKALRQIWWEKIWFQPNGRLLREASLKIPDRPLNYGSPIGGKVWWNGGPPGAVNVTLGGRLGAMSDNKTFISWAALCGKHEEELYHVTETGTTGIDEEDDEGDDES